MNANLRIAQIFVDELARAGLRNVCIAPGSRSTPLTLAFFNQSIIQTWMHLDERSAAFFALGLSLATDSPTAVVCTSGSAAANFFPAIIEARMSRVPFLILTADRPHELRGSGANQTIDQVKMYGDQVLLSVDMPVPDDSPSDLFLRHVKTLAARVVALANGLDKGPVHVNFPFRKPLEPATGEQLPAASQGRQAPFTCIERGALRPTPAQIERLTGLIQKHPRGLIVCGPRCPGGDFPKAATLLAQVTGYPLVADPLSGLRFGPHNAAEVVMGAQDAILSSGVTPWGNPELILAFGAVPVSASLSGYLARIRPVERLLVAEHGGWSDDDHRTTWLLQVDPQALCELVAERLKGPADPAWLASWRAAEKRAWDILDDELQNGSFFDAAAVALAVGALPEGGKLFVGNSLAVRHLDQFARPEKRFLEVFGNRGASGIDGNVSTALGIAAASQKPLLAILGDLTLYHDMNGLYACRRHQLHHTTFLVLNNHGGGIFQRLPIQHLDPPFTQAFLTPHEMTFRPAAELYGLDYYLCSSASDLETALKQRFKVEPQRSALIELPCSISNDLTRQQACLQAVKQQFLSK